MLIIIVYALIAILSCGFALFKGGPAERWGAAVYGGAWILVTVYEFTTGEGRPVIPILSMDLLVAVGFLVLAVRYNSLWLGAAMMLQGVEFGMHTLYLASDGAPQPHLFGWNAYGLGMNVIGLTVLMFIVGATCVTMAHHHKPRAQEDDLWEPREAT